MENFIDLSGEWSLKSADWEHGRTIPAQLPGDNYSALLKAGAIPDPYFGGNETIVQEFRKYEWEFEREFDVPASLLEYDSVYLNVEQLDTFGTIFINGHRVLTGNNMFRRYRPEVKPALKPGRNVIRIHFKSAELEAKKEALRQKREIPMNGCSKVEHLNLIRKVHCHGGWDWGITLMVTGVYAPLTLSGVNLARIDYVHTEQKHEKKRVTVTAVAELSALRSGRKTVTFTFNGETKTVTASLKKGENRVKALFVVDNPKLWWPNGLGEASLYLLTVSTDDETVEQEIGLRTLEVVNQPDEYGVSMYFRVNGFDVFCKGADWIPADAMPARVTPAVLDDLLESARLANMNMLRVWGGGQYESEEFYRLCDRKGLLIWQDMMFACSLYPSNEEFIENVRQELNFQIRRLRHHPSLALWCGDNEVIGATRWYGEDKRLVNTIHYDRLNRELARMVETFDPDRLFWPSSPCGGPNNFNDGWHDDSCGDMHYWEVWHGGREFSAYYSVKPRFCSEFGYQSFPSFETVKRFCPPEQFNVFSPVMDHHQKCVRGNAPIIGMFGKYFRMPESFENFLYLSQVQQALAIKTGVEFWRSLKPRCMGTIFWQLNDNWPVASWASIEYGGKWKQLQYHAKRFFAPVIGVLYQDEAKVLQLHLVSDLPVKTAATVTAVAYDFDGNELRRFDLSVSLRPNENRRLKSFKASELADLDPDACFIELVTVAETAEGRRFRHENTLFFSPFKRCDLHKAALQVQVEEKDGHYFCRLTTDKPAFFVTLDTPGIPGIFSDNSVTLLPGVPVELEFTPKRKTSLKELQKDLAVNDLRNTYN